MTLPGVSARLADQLLSRSLVTIAGYVSTLFAAELLLAQAGFFVGGISHVLLLVVLLAHYLAVEDAEYGPILLVLMLPSLMRLVSLTVPVVDLPVAAWFVMIGTPTYLAILLVIRISPVGLGRLLRWPPGAALQLVVALSGILHGLVLYLALRPAALVATTQPATALVVVAVLVVFVVLLEEIMFRGVIQLVALEVTRSRVAAVAVGSVVYACTFVSSDSFITPMLMLAIGVLFGATVALTRSLWGTVGAHASMTIGLLIVWPAVLG